MKLKTILTLPASDYREKLHLTRDWSAQRVARALPLRVRYFTTIRELGRATINSENVPATTLDEILKNLETPKGMS